MTDAEVTEFYRLLRMYANEIDQWERLQFESEYGTIWIALDRECPTPGMETAWDVLPQ